MFYRQALLPRVGRVSRKGRARLRHPRHLPAAWLVSCRGAPAGAPLASCALQCNASLVVAYSPPARAVAPDPSYTPPAAAPAAPQGSLGRSAACCPPGTTCSPARQPSSTWPGPEASCAGARGGAGQMGGGGGGALACRRRRLHAALCAATRWKHPGALQSPCWRHPTNNQSTPGPSVPQVRPRGGGPAQPAPPAPHHGQPAARGGGLARAAGAARRVFSQPAVGG